MLPLQIILLESQTFKTISYALVCKVVGDKILFIIPYLIQPTIHDAEI